MTFYITGAVGLHPDFLIWLLDATNVEFFRIFHLDKKEIKWIKIRFDILQKENIGKYIK